ncbi:type I-G CRISPR-associated protein Cas8g1/Csx17 [Phragmitibacter flavus]|nr:type I-U CRISPR-associated protein Csx17 [Phragmitibacter flavus]
MLNDIPLSGCSPTPLASYLKALGVFRLISEQADSSARGYWKNEAFVLSTKLTKEELAEFFLTRYAPTPVVDPWNRGSGFLSSGDKAAKNLASFEYSKAARLKPFRDSIVQVRAVPLLAKMRKVVNSKKEFDKTKPDFIKQCRLIWRGSLLEWLDAAVIIGSDVSLAWPSLLGTGGNDGRLDFTDNFRQRYLDLFDVSKPDAPPAENTAPLLEHALHGNAVTGTGNHSIGQYMPGAAGGANSSNGFDGRGNVNPWDFILFMEGSVLFAAAASRRLGATGVSSSSAPFAIRANSIGNASVSMKEKSARGEQWFPLWDRPAALREIRALLSEGRAQLGPMTVREPVDMARAIARLGVARGISAFERYGYIERNGQSTFAVPLGRWKVVSQPNQSLLSDLDTYLRRISREAAGKRATASLTTAARRLNDSVFAVAADGTSPFRWQDVLLALSGADALAATLPPSKNGFGIVPKLHSGWLVSANDGSVEFRLAVAFASQRGIRRYFLPLNKFGNQLDEKGDVNVVCSGRDFVADAIAFLDRRLIDSAKDTSRTLMQFADVFASLSDISSFLQGALDTGRIMSLARALMAIDYKDSSLIASPIGSEPPEDAFTLFRFCLAPRHWQNDPRHLQKDIPVRADIFRRLSSGDLSSASRLAASHLRAHGFIPPLSIAAGDSRLLAAALAFPLSSASRDILLRSFISVSDNNQPKNKLHQ